MICLVLNSKMSEHVWCDLLQDNGFISDYKMIGMHICMGDHKVSLFDCHSREAFHS